MDIITTHVGRWRQFTDKEKYLFIDTTYKSGDKRLAPDKDTLYGYKYGNLTKGNYIHNFTLSMRDSFRINNAFWQELINEKRIVVLACYCSSVPPAPPEFCHRNLLVNMFGGACKQKGLEFNYLGEK